MINFYNTLTKKEEEFKPIKDKHVGLYTCGPTVYSYVTVGNWRTYTLSDVVVRALKYFGYDVKYVMNITDVGHLTGDNEGDSSTGEDRMEKAEKKEGKTAWEIAEFYANDFYKGLDELNLIKPDVIPKPTEHITEQIDLVKDIQNAGFAYEISDGIYFDVKKYVEAGNKYGELSNLDEIKEGARVAINPEKKDPRDFALWKFSPKDSKRHMEWDSPWGVGFPGWHIECSAMGMKYLGEQFDLHIGGEDLRSTHHPSEIAQSEAATKKKPFVKYWIHGAFLLVEGGRMGKSLGNAYTLQDLKKRGYSPLDLRYFYFTGHYRKKLNFTWEALDAAKIAREKLAQRVTEFRENGEGQLISEFVDQFNSSVEDDFNMPKALAVVHELVKSNHSNEDKYSTILKFEEILGLGLDSAKETEHSSEVNELIEERNQARALKDWKTADLIRDKLREEFGVEVKDSA